MKTKVLIFSIFLILFLGCKQKSKRPTPNFYKNLFTEELLSGSEFKQLTDNLRAKNFDSIQGEKNIIIHFYELKISNDSVIQPFKYDIRVGNEYLVRADSFEKIGMEVTPQTFLTTDGDSIQIGGKQTKPTLINLWFVACGGCVAEIPALNKLREKYSDKVNFIAITSDDEKKVMRFLKSKEFNFKHITNAKKFIGYIGSKPYPENIFINRDGFIQNIEGGLGNQEDLDLVTKYFDSIIEKLLLPTNAKMPCEVK
jgi:thiol-disulfide isomerase/thioredoxin